MQTVHTKNSVACLHERGRESLQVEISLSLLAMEGKRSTDYVKDEQHFCAGCPGHSEFGSLADEDNIKSNFVIHNV